MSGSAEPIFDASTIEMVSRVLADAVTGPQINNLLAPLKANTGVEGDTKWKRINNAVVEAQNRTQDGRVLIRAIREVMDPVRFKSQDEMDKLRSMLNERLLLRRYEVRNDGVVIRAKVSTTLSDAQRRAADLTEKLARREVHLDVLHFCQPELLQENYFHAVLEATKSVAEKIRNRTGQSLDGTALVDATCSMGSGPVLKFNSLRSESEQSEQKGLAALIKGMFSAYRNPTAHSPKLLWATDEAEAVDVLNLASMLHRRIDGASLAA